MDHIDTVYNQLIEAYFSRSTQVHQPGALIKIKVTLSLSSFLHALPVRSSNKTRPNFKSRHACLK
jgi:hypothetical protein